VGGSVWLDNVRAVASERLSYAGPHRPAGIAHAPETLVTDWEVLGPLTRTPPRVEGDAAPSPAEFEGADGTADWIPFETDPRGAVLTGRVTEFTGDRTVAYFRTTIRVAERGRGVRLEFGSIDDLAVSALRGDQYATGGFFARVVTDGS